MVQGGQERGHLSDESLTEIWDHWALFTRIGALELIQATKVNLVRSQYFPSTFNWILNLGCISKPAL